MQPLILNVFQWQHGDGNICDWYKTDIGVILNYFTIVPKRNIPYIYIANIRSVMTGGRITHEETAKSIGVMSEGGRKQSLQVVSCDQGHRIQSIMGGRHGAMPHWLDRGDGIYSWGCVTLAGSGRWVWLMWIRDTGWTGAIRLIYGGAQHWLERGNGIDLWGRVMGVRDWIGEMGLICWGTPWGCDTGWMWAMGLSYGGVPWGRATG